MADAHFRVQVESDHLKRLSAARPIPAVAELIWNALDADATRVDWRSTATRSPCGRCQSATWDRYPTLTG